MKLKDRPLFYGDIFGKMIFQCFLTLGKLVERYLGIHMVRGMFKNVLKQKFKQPRHFHMHRTPYLPVEKVPFFPGRKPGDAGMRMMLQGDERHQPIKKEIWREDDGENIQHLLHWIYSRARKKCQGAFGRKKNYDVGKVQDELPFIQL